MPQTIMNRNTAQTWPAWRRGAQIGLLIAGFLATFVLPIFLLNWASDAFSVNRVLADQYSAWSYGLVVLGPGLFVTSFLAMGSTLPAAWRWVSRILAAALAIYIYIRLAEIGKDFFIPVILGIVSVVYCWLADAFTPNSSGEAKIRGAGAGPYPPSPAGSTGTAAETDAGFLRTKWRKQRNVWHPPFPLHRCP